MYPEQMTQGIGYVDVLNIANVNNTSATSLGFSLASGKRVIYTIFAPNLGAAGTIDARLQSSPTSAFSTVHNITNTNIAQIVTNNNMATIEVRADQVQQQNNGDIYVRLRVDCGGNSLLVGALGQMGDSIQKPAKQYNLANTLLGQQIICNT